MADLSLVGTTTSTIRVKLVDLDERWSSGPRYAHFYISHSGYSTNMSDYDGNIELAEQIKESQPYTFRGLEENTRYYIVCQVKRGDNGNVQVTLRLTESTDWDEPAVELSLFVGTDRKDTISARVSGLDTIPYWQILYCHWYARQKGSSSWGSENGNSEVTDPEATESARYYYTGLTPGTYYELKCEVKYPNNTIAGIAIGRYAYLMPFPEEELDLPYFSITDVTSNTAYINISNLGNPFTTQYYNLVGVTTGKFIEQGAASVPATVMGTKRPESSSGTAKYTGFQVTGLLPNTRYTFYCYAMPTGGKYYAISSSRTSASYGISFTTGSVGRPDDWVWTDEELLALYNEGPTSRITIARWNMFIDRVNDFVEYVNVTSSIEYTEVGDVHRMDSTGILRAIDFNRVAEVIKNISGTSEGFPQKVASGDFVHGRYLINMAAALNSI